MLILHQFARTPEILNLSPFCMKVELYLRMAGVPHEINLTADPRRAPKRKLPVLSDNEVMISDSEDIIAYLKQHYGDPLDAELSEDQRAQALMARRMCENHLYFATLYFRWIDPQGWPVTRELIFGKLPGPVKWLIGRAVRGKIHGQLDGQGMGRHAPAEIYARAADDLAALACFMGDRRYALGAKPTSLDATVFAFLAGIYFRPPLDNPLRVALAKHDNLVAYTEQMQIEWGGF